MPPAHAPDAGSARKGEVEAPAPAPALSQGAAARAALPFPVDASAHPATAPPPPLPAVVDAAAAVHVITAFFETLAPETLEGIGFVYAPEARFKDPFNEVRGLAAIADVYQHMFASLQEPRFEVTGSVLQGRECFLTWNFRFRFQGIQPGVPQTVRGCSHLVLDARGRIAVHRDYWDVAEEMYEKIPGLGRLMRWLKNRARS